MRFVKGIHIDDVVVKPTGAAEPVTLHVWQNPETGQLVAVDNLELPADRNYVLDPYQDGVAIVFADTFTGLPK